MAKTYSWCEGYAAFRLGRECKYPADATQDRQDWAEGFLEAIDLDRKTKVWWKSRTMQVASACIIAGVAVVLLGMHEGGSTGNMMMAGGGTLTLKSIVDTYLRTTTSQPVSWGGTGYGQSNYGG